MNTFATWDCTLPVVTAGVVSCRRVRPGDTIPIGGPIVAMSMIVEAPEPLAGRLTAKAARRGVAPTELAVETLEGAWGPAAPADNDGDVLGAFIGSFDSGDPDWASTATAELRSQAAGRHTA